MKLQTVCCVKNLAMKKKKLAQQDCKTAFRLGASAEQVAPLLGELK